MIRDQYNTAKYADTARITAEVFAKVLMSDGPRPATDQEVAHILELSPYDLDRVSGANSCAMVVKHCWEMGLALAKIGGYS
jgi:hypothetical protein